MAAPKARSKYGDGDIDRSLTELLATVGTDANDDLVRKMLVTVLDMDASDLSRLDLKIATQTLAEMLNTFKVFSPYADRGKVTVFGSARTQPGHADYELAKDFCAKLAEHNWMIISGAGPGIMTAAIEGAGVENSMGINIELPFEQDAASIIADDPKLATFKYFFTRKLTFIKEANGFALFPGGFGTHDEGFELLTLIQTGKSYPMPVVLLDSPGSTYWESWLAYVKDELLGGGMISTEDVDLFKHTHDPTEAAEWIVGFYGCYHSVRYFGPRVVMRLQHQISDECLQTLNDEFADIVTEGTIERCEPSKEEKAEDDNLDLPRIRFRFNQHDFARLSQLIMRLNELSPATDSHHRLPAELGPDPEDQN